MLIHLKSKPSIVTMCANNLFKTQAIKLLKYIRFTCFIISPPRLFFGSYNSPDMLFMRFFTYVCFKREDSFYCRRPLRIGVHWMVAFVQWWRPFSKSVVLDNGKAILAILSFAQNLTTSHFWKKRVGKGEPLGSAAVLVCSGKHFFVPFSCSMLEEEAT